MDKMSRMFAAFAAVCACAAADAREMDCGKTLAEIDDATGRILGVRSGSGAKIASEFELTYFTMSKGRDVEALESEDRAVLEQGPDGALRYVCTNPRLPGVSVVKTYRRRNGGVRRTVEFRGAAANACTIYVTPFERCRFADGFKKGLWHLGAGYIGPYRPYPDVSAPSPVNQYRQSSKGLVFTHPRAPGGGFAHYRVAVDGTVVLPWFHSTIGHYREYHDRLYYLPDGYKMGLGTFDVRPGGGVSVSEQFEAFDGGLFGFFDDVLGRDEDVRRELDSIPPAPEWIQNIACIVWNVVHDDYLRWLTEMMDGADFIACACLFNSWGDYRFDPETDSLQGNFGGRLTRGEVLAYYGHLRSLSGRVHPCCYQNVVSAGKWTRVAGEHPEWFRTLDRDGNQDSLFPNCSLNYQTMFTYPRCREWMADMLASFARGLGADVCYTDETQMTNTIDWERDAVTRDDDCVKFWRLLKRRLHDDGTMYFANGSGLPYVDLNYMESPHEMRPESWRDWVGVAFGIGMLNRMKPGNRTSPLYWTQQCDYVNRFLALGWVPASPAGLERLMPIRAQWQCGHMVPSPARYSPDWREDFSTEVESHCQVRRGCRDVVLSFINRGDAADVPVSIDASTLGFAPSEEINVWKGHFDETSAARGPVLSDAELRANWRGEGAVDGATMYSPELVFSGPASGKIEDVVAALGRNRMEQYLVTAAPLQFFAVDDIPLNQYYTTAKGCRIDGNVVTNASRVDVLLAHGGRSFANVTVNGRRAGTRAIRLRGRDYQLLTLEPGRWKIGWEAAPRDGGEPQGARLPATPRARKSSVRPFARGIVIPGKRVERACGRGVGGVSVEGAYEWITDCETAARVQPDMHPGIATADAERLRLTAGASRREAVNTSSLRCWAGLRIRGARLLRLRFSHTLQEVHGSHTRYTYPWGWGKPTELFTGFVVDYHSATGYVKRVTMSTGLFSPGCEAVLPWWGTASDMAHSENLAFGEWIEDAAPREFVLDIGRFAPPGWDGEVVFSLGEDKLGAGRRLEAELLGFNEEAQGERLEPRRADNIRDVPAPVVSRRQRVRPRSVAGKYLYSEDWDKWAKLPGKFTRLVMGVARKDTTVYLAHDFEYVYVGVKCEEDDRDPFSSSSTPYQNEHVEVCILRGDGKVLQYLGDVKGHVACYLDRKEVPVPSGTVCRGENCRAWGAGWRVFFAIPLDSLKPDMQRTPVVVRANVCRSRKLGEAEFTSWAPMEQNNVYDFPKYGTWILHFD